MNDLYDFLWRRGRGDDGKTPPLLACLTFVGMNMSSFFSWID